MNRRMPLLSAALLIASVGASPVSSRAQSVANAPAPAAKLKAREWVFAVSGDSRNCGDVVMPAIARGAKQSGAAFYWHLGDLRAIYEVDEDILHQPEHLWKPLTKSEYLDMAWNDFIENQIAPFGTVPLHYRWMRERAHRADSAMIWSGEDSNRSRSWMDPA